MLADNIQLAEAIPGIVFELDKDFTVRDVSSKIEDLGYSEADVIGMPLPEFIHTSHRDRVVERFQNKKINEEIERGNSTIRMNVRFIFGPEVDHAKTGETGVYNLQCNVLFDDSEGQKKIDTVIGVIRDTEDQDDVRQELELKERAMASASEGITIARAEGKDNPLIYVNKGFERLTGYSREEVIGKDCRFLQGEKTKDENVREIREALDENKPVRTELINYRKNGESFHNRISITPVRNDSGEVTHYVGIQKDITELKEQRKELRQAEKLTAVGEMAAGVMHEINNPNAVIKGDIQFLVEAWSRLQSVLKKSDIREDQTQFYLDELEDTLKEIQRSSERIEKIVEKVELFTRKENRNDYKDINPLQSIKQTLNTFEEAQRELIKLDVSKDVRNQEISVKGNEFEIQQLITNLIENALDATCSESTPNITLRAFKDHDHFCLDVIDNGQGIPEKHRDYIFDPFYTTKPPGKGTGLGLSIVNGIVERMDGEITVDTEVDVGTTFSIRLPLQKNN
ncbi:MAG: PAS domain-containing protein [bacterium]